MELRLHPTNNVPSATLTKIDEQWPEDSTEPQLKVTDIPLKTPAELKQTLEASETGLPVILVYASPETRYGQLMAYLRPVLDTHGIIYVYLE